MTVREYAEKFGIEGCDRIGFIQAKPVHLDSMSKKRFVYQTTPLRLYYEWKEGTVVDSVILNDRASSIDWLSGASWKNEWIMLIVKMDDLIAYYGEEQAKELIEFIDNKIEGFYSY